MNRAIFSIITMASSTTNPVEFVSAINDRLSRLNPTSFMTPNVPITASGSATLGMTVAQNLRRKTNITITTSTTVRISVNCTSRTEARMVSVWSVKIDTLTAGGIDARSSAAMPSRGPPFQ